MKQDFNGCLSSIATWTPLIAALATFLVGMSVALIAYRQWRVAHEKLILDLFDRRFAVYSEAREAVQTFWTPINTAPKVTNTFDRETYTHRMARIATLHDVGRRAEFLFGDEVAARIKIVREALIDGTPSAPWEEEDDEARRRSQEPYKRAHKEAAAFPKDLDRLVSKYMRITRAL